MARVVAAGEAVLLNIEAVAEAYGQHRSARTPGPDLSPFKEPF